MSIRVPYVQSAASQQVPPPYHFPDVTVNAFYMNVSMERVQRYCDMYLNIGDEKTREYVYRPLAAWPYATVLYLNYPTMISAAPASPHLGEVPYSDRGAISQTEVFVAIPVVRYGRGAKRLITDTALEWALPFIVVGNPMSSVCGREMLGLGKLLAEIENGVGRYPESFHGRISLPGWPDDEPGTMQRMQEFMRIETKPVLPTPAGTQPPYRTLATLLESPEASKLVGGLSSVSNFIDSFSLGLIPTSMRTVGLKQYRDAADPQRAVYQALVTCRAQYLNVRNVRFYNELDIDMYFNDIGSFHEILEVFLEVDKKPTGKPHSVNTVAARRFEADINFDTLRVIREFPIDRDGVPPTPGASDLVSRWYRPLRGFFGPRRGVGLP
ncbi:hypothetical protein [Novosphingobium sp. NDB2Meth1]|uniref:hypothetical protein n=1 Tax=Novosphingobium sp. NDB2Meth1 TaxID=1892847 RepID=UPI0009319B1B|nr:hypothetical protein [Novosphingobium sp. NDB2Meth1]